MYRVVWQHMLRRLFGATSDVPTVQETTLHINAQHIGELRGELSKVLDEDRRVRARIEELERMIRVARSTSEALDSSVNDVFGAYFDAMDTLEIAIRNAREEKTMFSILHVLSMSKMMSNLDTTRAEELGLLNQNALPKYEADLKSHRLELEKLTKQKKSLHERIVALETTRANLLGLDERSCVTHVTLVTTRMPIIPATAPAALVIEDNFDSQGKEHVLNTMYPTLLPPAPPPPITLKSSAAVVIGEAESEDVRYRRERPLLRT